MFVGNFAGFGFVGFVAFNLGWPRNTPNWVESWAIGRKTPDPAHFERARDDGPAMFRVLNPELSPDAALSLSVSSLFFSVPAIVAQWKLNFPLQISFFCLEITTQGNFFVFLMIICLILLNLVGFGVWFACGGFVCFDVLN